MQRRLVISFVLMLAVSSTILLSGDVALAGKPGGAPCSVEGECTPWMVEEPTSLAVVGTEVDAWTWNQGRNWIYGYTDNQGPHTIGTLRFTAHINLNGRQSQWRMTSDVWEGPSIRPMHVWNCVDRNGNLPSGSCSLGEQTRESSVYTKALWAHEDNNYHRDNSEYYYYFEFWWQAAGYPQWIYRTPQLDSGDFGCRAVEAGPCRFTWAQPGDDSMPIAYAQDPRDRRGKGTVWLAVDETGGWFGYWDMEPDGPPEPLEQGPGWETAGEAVAWGRSRAKRVFIRLEWGAGYWWAGEGPPPDGADVEGVYQSG